MVHEWSAHGSKFDEALPRVYGDFVWELSIQVPWASDLKKPREGNEYLNMQNK